MSLKEYVLRSGIKAINNAMDHLDAASAPMKYNGSAIKNETNATMLLLGEAASKIAAMVDADVLAGLTNFHCIPVY